MITSGYFIGEIVDELSAISHQVNTRCALGLTDLNVFLENFFRDILNLAFDLSLVNLNEERSNAPGLDLGDKSTGKGFQVTSRADAAKINETLKKISKSLNDDYPEIFILIIGTKQSSYTLDIATVEKLNFSKENILDIKDICKRVVVLDIETLQEIHSLVKKQVSRIKVELEIPNADGSFPTSFGTYVEEIPKPKASSFERYFKFQKTKHGDLGKGLNEVQDEFSEFIKGLIKLPRITREFYAFLLERRADDESRSTGYIGQIFFNISTMLV